MPMLRKLLIASCIATVTAAAQADALGLRFGAQRWQQNYDGTVRSGNTNINLENDLGFDDDRGNVFFVAFDHPLPFLPNVMLQRTELRSTATTGLNRSIEFDGAVYPVATTVKTDLDLSHTDATFYYRLLDNWAHLQAGLTVRKFDQGVKIRSLTFGYSSSVDIDNVLPMLYLAAKLDLPFTGLYVGADINGIPYNGKHLYDARVNVGYELPFGLGAELGYRRFDLDYDDDDDRANVTIDGAYAGVFFHF